MKTEHSERLDDIEDGGQDGQPLQPGGIAPELLREVRNALEIRRAETSLRATAREVGISPTGLSQLLQSAMPYRRTVQRLLAWYANWLGARGSRDVATEHALSVLLDRVPPDRKDDARRDVLEVLDEYLAK
ncbi:MAG TPA: hypothetical protein VF746_30075 [Longimicrobium sp.]|jgi:hypothetical protein